MATGVISLQIELIDRECSECGIPFAAPDYFWEQRKRDGERWYCPNGHCRIFSESDATRLAAARSELERIKGILAEEQRSTSELVGRIVQKDQEIKRMRRRAKAGVCQSCHRTFQNVARHMQTKHGSPEEREKARIAVLEKKKAK